MKKVVVMLALLAAVNVFAEVPNEITYQGKLKEYGQPVTGNRTVNFKIYNTVSGPGLQWESGDVSVSVSSGVFSYILTPALDWRQKDLWIETVVSGKTLSPREKITSQAYALHSKTAEDLSKPDGSTIDFVIGGSTRARVSNTGEISSLIGNTTYYMVPRGAIIMWSGSTIPAGWALCDGTNGTPDMRDRFVLGAGNSYILGNTGGSGSHSHTIQGHAHSMPQTHLFYIGNHTHTYGGNVGVASNSAHADGNGSVGILASADHLHSYSGTTGATNLSGGTEQSSSARTGSETLTSNDTTVLPPYFAISFIMKL